MYVCVCVCVCVLRWRPCPNSRSKGNDAPVVSEGTKHANVGRVRYDKNVMQRLASSYNVENIMWFSGWGQSGHGDAKRWVASHFYHTARGPTTRISSSRPVHHNLSYRTWPMTSHKVFQIWRSNPNRCMFRWSAMRDVMVGGVRYDKNVMQPPAAFS